MTTNSTPRVWVSVYRERERERERERDTQTLLYVPLSVCLAVCMSVCVCMCVCVCNTALTWGEARSKTSQGEEGVAEALQHLVDSRVDPEVRM